MEQRSLLEKKDEVVAKTKDKLARSAKMQVYAVAVAVAVDDEMMVVMIMMMIYTKDASVAGGAAGGAAAVPHWCCILSEPCSLLSVSYEYPEPHGQHPAPLVGTGKSTTHIHHNSLKLPRTCPLYP